MNQFHHQHSWIWLCPANTVRRRTRYVKHTKRREPPEPNGCFCHSLIEPCCRQDSLRHGCLPLVPRQPLRFFQILGLSFSQVPSTVIMQYVATALAVAVIALCLPPASCDTDVEGTGEPAFPPPKSVASNPKEHSACERHSLHWLIRVQRQKTHPPCGVCARGAYCNAYSCTRTQKISLRR